MGKCEEGLNEGKQVWAFRSTAHGGFMCSPNPDENKEWPGTVGADGQSEEDVTKHNHFAFHLVSCEPGDSKRWNAK